MAVDTANKRGSVIVMLPLPDGTIDQADRQQTPGLYAGILAGGLMSEILLKDLWQYHIGSMRFDISGTTYLWRHNQLVNISTGTPTYILKQNRFVLI